MFRREILEVFRGDHVEQLNGKPHIMEGYCQKQPWLQLNLIFADCCTVETFCNMPCGDKYQTCHLCILVQLTSIQNCLQKPWKAPHGAAVPSHVIFFLPQTYEDCQFHGHPLLSLWRVPRLSWFQVIVLLGGCQTHCQSCSSSILILLFFLSAWKDNHQSLLGSFVLLVPGFSLQR